ncbi:LOW QUALITY PROTEIN: ATPase family AAA domain-containing protein 5b [Anoplopoma fimbria]|uniref:LOW QUALITY PROTEIN: ATPase family AAA domain-containing protein 5b n=1 Tax=Anoplopoma fimbria TaxID=229290 RepID=UPI0023ED4C2A|nr:LOW QUALITY PROTEIN: ATPase family AAA domain-containing protein 5b [Anoplopoma fimbria]
MKHLQKRAPARDTQVSAAGIFTTKAPPLLQEQPRTLCAKDVKIAQIFLRKTQREKGKGSRDGKLQQQAVLPLQSEDVQPVTGQQCSSTERKSSCRGQLSASALHICLQEIQTSSPAFPVRTVFSTLQKKACERLQDVGTTAENISSLQNHLQEKRKRGNESSERMPKRLRSGLTEEAFGTGHCGVQDLTVLTVKKQPGSNKLSRTHRLGQQSGSPAGPEPFSGSINHTEPHSQSLKTSEIPQRDSSFEDVLWTDKYSPQHSSEVIGNSASVNKLQIWLKKWKLRADCEERRKMDERKQENSNSSWDSGDFQGESGPEDDGEEPLCNTVLITGPPGVGKTASVYACAQELGFKVFEVNCSSRRSGRHVLSQLKEATQSHLVETSGKDPLKPTYFNNYTINSCTPKSETLPGKTVRLKNVTSTSKNRAAQKFGRSSRKGKNNPATVTLANYFKMKAKADHVHFGGPSPSGKPDGEKSSNPSTSSDQTAPKNRKTATSLILFEEVDVIFDDDVGFLEAIKTFMRTTKRPVVLTTSDPSFRERFNCSLEEIIFKSPSVVNVCSYLQLVGLAENVRLELDDVSSLHRLSRGDVRRCLLQLQLWVHSGGGRASRSGGSLQEPSREQHLGVTERGNDEDSQHPHCDPGCTASMLGLHHVTQHQLLNLLKRQFWSEIDMNQLLRLLAESWRGGVPLLYSNLELLLPTGSKGTCPGLQRELAPSDSDPPIWQLDGNVSKKEPDTNSRSVKKTSRLSRRKCVPATIDATSASSLRQHPQRASLSPKRAASSRDETEKTSANVATDCLEALTDFFDLMSYLDSTTPAAAGQLVSGQCRPEAFVWTGAEIKDGLLDEMSEDEEVGGVRSQERLLDIRAAVEGLGCHRCCWRMSRAWTEAQKRTGTGRHKVGGADGGTDITGLFKRQSLTFCSHPPCTPSVSKRRYEMSRKVLGSPSFSLLGNRQAVSVDYMPVLRHICRLQRAQEQKEEPVRCRNYLSSTHLGLSKSTIQLLAEDFS